MGDVAVAAVRSLRYEGAGTLEFLLDESGEFYFMEMNTRLQVEHPVTELVTGMDLVREMVRIAQGESLGFSQQALVTRGAAIECRVYAEDPANGFLPSPGIIEALVVPAGPGVRDDGSAYPGCAISSYYDPLVSKLCAWAPTRPQAIARMKRALSEYVLTGIRTNLSFHENLLRHPEFAAGRYDTGFIARHEGTLTGTPELDPKHRDALAIAVAAAVVRASTAAEPDTAVRRPMQSPWLAHHRARLRL
jgi:acetyl-CoA carboxylase biotin carboxylase subunit